MWKRRFFTVGGLNRLDVLFTRLGFLGFGARRGMTDGAKTRVL